MDKFCRTFSIFLMIAVIFTSSSLAFSGAFASAEDEADLDEFLGGSNGESKTSSALMAIEYAVEMGASIINCSWGSMSGLNGIVNTEGMVNAFAALEYIDSGIGAQQTPEPTPTIDGFPKDSV